MFLLVLFYFYIYTDAVKFYGDVPSTEIYTSIVNRLAKPVDANFTLHSVFASSDLATRNGSDFLSENGIPDMTLMQLVQCTMSSSDLSARDRADQLNCQNNQVVDKISPADQKHICTTVKTLVGGTIGAVSAFIGGSGIIFTSSEIGDYCLGYMSANDKKCSSQGVGGETGNKRAHVAVVNTQSDYTSCSGLRGQCTEITL